MKTLEKIYSLFLNCNQKICIDSRYEKIKNSIFFGIKGPNFDGNLYAENALKKGAKYAIVDKNIDSQNDKIIKVNNTTKTLQSLAKLHRSNWGSNNQHKSVVGITGTNGKTTTKEILKSILCTEFNICSTKGNLNNHIGVPLTILSLKREHDIGIIELGANHQGEINLLCEISQPTHGIITNIGKAHLEGFKNIETIKKTKNELYRYIKKTNGTLFVNKLDPILIDLIKNYKKTIFYNCEKLTNKNCKHENFYFKTNPFINLCFKNFQIPTKILGTYNAQNIAASIIIARHFKMSLQDIIKNIAKVELTNNRSQLINTKNNQIILDAYNANPTSVTLAVENFVEFIKTPKYKENLIILGDMLELGNNAQKYHQQIVNLLEKKGLKNCILIGENFQKTKIKNNYLKFLSLDECKSLLKKEKIIKKNILIKGSRKMQLEKIVDLL